MCRCMSLPGPAEVGKSLIEMFADGTVYPHLWATTYEVILGFIIGSVLGMALGYLFIKVDVLRTALMPYLIFSRQLRRSRLFRFCSLV